MGKIFFARPRFAVRILLKNPKGEICMIVSRKNNYCRLPSGGIEDNESIEEVLCRETLEETGFMIKNVKPLGYTSEKGILVNAFRTSISQIQIILSARNMKPRKLPRNSNQSGWI